MGSDGRPASGKGKGEHSVAMKIEIFGVANVAHIAITSMSMHRYHPDLGGACPALHADSVSPHVLRQCPFSTLLSLSHIARLTPTAMCGGIVPHKRKAQR